MKKLLVVCTAAVIITMLIFGSTLVATSATATPGPTVVTDKPVQKWDKKGKITVLGSGFDEGQELHLMFTDATGVRVDFTSYSVSPAVEVNENGAFAGQWKGLGRFISKKLLKAGAYSIEVTDADYNILASTPFQVLEKEEEKK